MVPSSFAAFAALAAVGGEPARWQRLSLVLQLGHHSHPAGPGGGVVGDDHPEPREREHGGGRHHHAHAHAVHRELPTQ